MPAPSIHPLKKIEKRIRDMLAVSAPVWKIAQVLEISEETISRHYRHLLDEFSVTPSRKQHEPSPRDRERVKLMTIAGICQDDVAKVIGISKPTLELHYREELDLAMIEANSRVAGNLFMMATGNRESKTTVTAAIWWTKARMGWKDTSRVESTGADGGPVQVENQFVVVLPDNRREATIDGEAIETPMLPEIVDETTEGEDQDC
jgi:hypothetical protein